VSRRAGVAVNAGALAQIKHERDSREPQRDQFIGKASMVGSNEAQVHGKIEEVVVGNQTLVSEKDRAMVQVRSTDAERDSTFAALHRALVTVVRHQVEVDQHQAGAGVAEEAAKGARLETKVLAGVIDDLLDGFAEALDTEHNALISTKEDFAHKLMAKEEVIKELGRSLTDAKSRV
jgi:hypothetical protein